MAVHSFKFRGEQWLIPAWHTLALRGLDGASWYTLARRSIRRYAWDRGIPEEYVCDVLAIVSPRVSVEYSVELAKDYIERGDTSRLMSQRAKALEVYERTGRFNGPKVNAFSRALQGDPEAVVIDAWMYRAGGDVKPSRMAYKRLTERVRRTAREVGLPPAETQAAIWTATRRLVGFPNAGDLRL